MSYNNNPTGKNQHGIVPKADDEVLANALRSYHREQLTNNKKISTRLLSDHGIKMSDMSVKRRRKELGLTGSRNNTKNMPQQEAEQLVLNQMGKDPSGRQGIRTIQAKIAFEEGQHLTRDFVSKVVHVEKMKAFNEQHAPMCEGNWVCSQLGLKHLIVEQDDRPGSKTPSPRKPAHRGRIEYIVN